MKVLVLEPEVRGHRMQFARHCCEAFSSAGHETTLVTRTENLGDASVEACQPFLKGNAVVTADRVRKERPDPNPLVSAVLQRESYLELKSFYKKASANSDYDVVCVPYIDQADKTLAVMPWPFGSASLVGITMKQAFQYPLVFPDVTGSKADAIEQFTFLRLIGRAKVRKILTIDIALDRWADKNISGKLREKVQYTPDPVKNMSTVLGARESLGIPEGLWIVLVYGALDRRKGLQELLDSIVEAGSKDIGVLVAGRQTPASDTVLASESALKLKSEGRLFSVIKYLDDREEETVFSAPDAVWLGYRNHFGSSGVLGQAAAMGKPVIASSSGIIGSETRENSLGVTMKSLSASDIADAISTLRERELADLKGCLALFAAKRSLSVFEETVLKSIEPITP